MNLSARDKKIALILAPVVLIAAYWFLLFAPKREEAATAQTRLAEAEKARDAAEDQLRLAQTSKQSFASDYSTMVRLGKAIPESVDMPSLLVQLDGAARGTNIDFLKVSVSEPEAPQGTVAPTAPSGGPPVAAGGETAQSAPGQAAEGATNATADANAASAAAEQSGVNPADTQTSTTAGADPTAAAATGAPALATVGLELEFEGSFFDLADFFHRLKRFVEVENQGVVVNGRLVTIENISFSSESFPSLTATVSATAYVAPEAQGATAGATAAGPATVPAAAPGAAPAPATPTATVTP